MAEKQCNLIKNGGGMSKVKVIATANANQTYASQLASISSAYSGLSDDDKSVSFVRSGSQIFGIMQSGLGSYARYSLDASSTYLAMINISARTYITAYGASGSPMTCENHSSDNNTNTMELCIPQ